MIREELEFLIASYADGTLAPDARPVVNAELTRSAEARELLADYRRLDAALAGLARSPTPVGDLALDASSLGEGSTAGAAVADADESSRQPLDDESAFLISCYFDGGLEPASLAEARLLLDRDERARAFLDELRDLDGATRAVAYANPAPAGASLDLCGAVGALLDAGVGAAIEDEAFERSIADYASGSLAGADRQSLEARLEVDAGARLALAQYRNLDDSLAQWARLDPAPTVRWAAQAQRIMAKLPAAPARKQSAWRFSPLRLGAGLAAAASVVIAASVGLRLAGERPAKIAAPVARPAVEVASIVQVAPAESPAGPEVAEIKVGPPASAGRDDYALDEDDIVSHPPRASVASGRPLPSDADLLPAMPF